MSDVHFQDHVLIVGAGVIGLSIAWELARLGSSVVVIDRDQPGSGATTTAGGMLGLTAEAKFDEQDLLDLEKKSLLLFSEYVAALRRDSGVDPHYSTEPTLVVASDRDDIEALERVFDYQKSVGLPVRWLDEKQLRMRAPRLRNARRAVSCPNDHSVDTGRLTEALVLACRHRGVQLLDGMSARAVISDRGRCRGVELSTGQKLFAHRTIIAAGCWSARIEGIPEMHRTLLRPVRGQMITIDGGPRPLLDTVVRTPEVYVIPRRDGRLLVGSTMEEKGYRAEVTAGAVHTLLREAWRILPGIDDLPISSLLAGFRPVSLDDRPLLGPSRLEDLFLATGHGRHGILLAPASAEAMARHIFHPRWAQQTYRAFDPRRFSQ